MHINRLFEIIYILLNDKTSTAKKLADHFEVTTRTIYRDIETLSAAGIPIYTHQGRYGGILLLENFVLNKLLLSDGEQNEIISALQGLSATNNSQADDVLSKLSTLFNKDNQSWIDLDFSDWSGNNDKFETIKASILNQSVVIFDYYNQLGEKSERVVEPIKLIFKEKRWYLKAFCTKKNALRLFKLTRIKNLHSTNTPFKLHSVNECEDIPSEHFKREIVTLKLKIDSSLAYRVYDEFEPEAITKQDDCFIVNVCYPEDEWVYGYILSFGDNIVALDPPHIKDIIKKKLTDALQKY